MSAEMNSMTSGPARYTKHNVTKVRAHESIWESTAYNDGERKFNLVRGKSTPNIAQDSQASQTSQRVGSHISAKIRELQQCQEPRKRRVSDTSVTLEAQTSAETFKDARQIVFLEDTPSITEKENIFSKFENTQNSSNSTTKSLVSTKSTSFIPQTVNTNPKPFTAKLSTQVEHLNSKKMVTESSTQDISCKVITKEVPKPEIHSHVPSKNTAIAQKLIPSNSRALPSQLNVKTETTFPNSLPPPNLPSTPPLMVITSLMSPEINIENSDSEQETILFEKPPEQLHSETIRIRTTSESDQTLELTVTVSQKPTQHKEEINSNSLLSPAKRLQFSLDENAPKPSFKPRRSFLFPNFLTLLPTASNNDRRNSEPLARMKPPRIQDTEDIEILSFKLEAVAVNAAFLLARAQDFCGTVEQLIELEEEIERTQRALDDVEVMAPVNMKMQVARATRALNACKMLLEERAPSIEMQEIAERRRSSAVAGSDVRSVSMRVMKLNKEEEKRRSSIHDGSP